MLSSSKTFFRKVLFFCLTIITLYIIIIIDNKGGGCVKNTIKDLMHPVRVRIIQLFVHDEHRTTSEIHEILEDIALPTLYRHLHKLLTLKVLEVVKEEKIRGTVEKTYGLNNAYQEKAVKDYKSITKEEHIHLFFGYLMQMLQEFEQYFQDDFDILRDGLSYRLATFHLNTDELIEMSQKMNEVLMEYYQKAPSKDANEYLLYSISIPKRKKEEKK